MTVSYYLQSVHMNIEPIVTALDRYAVLFTLTSTKETHICDSNNVSACQIILVEVSYDKHSKVRI